MSGHLLLAAALLFKAEHHPATDLEVVLEVEAYNRAHAGKGVDHRPQEGAISKTDQCARIDAVEQDSGIRAFENRRLTGRNNVFRAPHVERGVARQDLAHDQKAPEHSDRGQVLLDRWRGVSLGRLRRRASHPLDVGGDVERLHSL